MVLFTVFGKLFWDLFPGRKSYKIYLRYKAITKVSKSFPMEPYNAEFVFWPKHTNHTYDIAVVAALDA